MIQPFDLDDALTRLATGRDYAKLTSAEVRVGLEVANVGLGRVDYVRETMVLDPLAAVLFDLPANTQVPRSELHKRIHDDDWPHVSAEIERLLTPGAPDVVDVTHRIQTPDGSDRWVNARKRVTFAGAGDTAMPVTGVFAVKDVTERKTAELRSTYLIGELNHRTKNLITVVTAITRQLKRHSDPAEVPDKLLDRLGALARNQDAIVGHQNVDFELGEVLNRQVGVLDPSAVQRIEINGDPVTISTATAQTFAMASHELITNSLKHGALAQEAADVQIKWQIDDVAERLVFQWTERGCQGVTEPNATGYGKQILTRFVEGTLAAEALMEFKPTGLNYVVRIPLDRLSS